MDVFQDRIDDIRQKLKDEKNKLLKDLNLREVTILVPIVILILWIGIYPLTFMKKTEKSVEYLLNLKRIKSERTFLVDKVDEFKIEIGDEDILSQKISE